MTLQPGSRPVPDYQLIRKLGAGAFGEVWHAHGPGGLDVALKFIRVDAHGLARELRSLEAVKSIRHPNLVSLFGVWGKDNWLILAMELCDRTLRDRLAEALYQKQPGIPLEELLNYMSDAANGLDALNTKQVQHRDVKPANLLLLNSGVKVADYGLAKALEQTVASNSGAGTLAYTAPECFKGELTQQSDQYSLAVTYYHLRTGHLLFKGDQAKVMYAHLELEPDLSRLPAAEGAVLARALSKEPGKRWGNCNEFVNELINAQLQQALEGERPPKLQKLFLAAKKLQTAKLHSAGLKKLAAKMSRCVLIDVNVQGVLYSRPTDFVRPGIGWYAGWQLEARPPSSVAIDPQQIYQLYVERPHLQGGTEFVRGLCNSDVSGRAGRRRRRLAGARTRARAAIARSFGCRMPAA